MGRGMGWLRHLCTCGGVDIIHAMPNRRPRSKHLRMTVHPEVHEAVSLCAEAYQVSMNHLLISILMPELRKRGFYPLPGSVMGKKISHHMLRKMMNERGKYNNGKRIEDMDAPTSIENLTIFD